MRETYRIPPLATVAFTALFVAAGLCYGQSQPGNAQGPSVQEFFQSIRNNPAALPAWKDFDTIQIRIPEMPPEELISTLPTIMTVLANPNPEVKRYAAGALVAVSTRPDSAQLLRQYIDPIAALLDSPQDYLQRGALGIFGLLKPIPPPEIFPRLFAFLRRTDRDPQIQVGALSIVLYHKPQDPAVIEAVQDFASRRLDTGTRMSMLKGIRLSRTTDLRIEDVVLRSLDEPSPGVKISAIDALDRMGKSSLMKAEPQLRKLSESPNEHPEVKAAAAKALKSLQVETH